jgi:hypothetical protein
MPFYLNETNIYSELDGLKSVLIVPCRFCPAASMAVRAHEAYIDFPRRILKTPSYEGFIRRIKSGLQNRGIKTSIFKSRLLHQFVLCMWTSRRRRNLRELAKQYDALVVMGCEAAVQTVKDSVQSTECKVIQGMKNEGVMSIRPKFRLPCNITLDLESVSPILLAQQ